MNKLYSKPKRFILPFLLLKTSLAQDACSQCVCSPSKVNCAGTQTNLPISLPQNTNSLDLSNTGLLGTLSGKFALNSPYLSDLVLNQNSLETIQTDAFSDNLKTLQRLSISSNLLKSLPSSVFDRLTQLKLLDLHSNQLHFIQRWLFNGLTSLQLLDLSQNQITLIHHEAFNDVPNLVEIRLNNNKIKSLPTFPGTLDRIYLYDNPLLCDCVMKDFVKEAKEKFLPKNAIQNADYVQCHEPPEVEAMSIFKLLNHQFVCVKPRITHVSDIQRVASGELLSLECHAMGFPEPDISWLGPDGHIVSTRHILYLPSVTIEDQGWYECKARNAQGEDTRSVNVQIEQATEHADQFHQTGLRKDCPRPCHCYLDIVDCRNKDLTSLPAGLESNHWMNKLYLSGNKIKKITGLPSQLRHLSLDDNPLTELDTASFSRLKSLTHLSLKNCSISSIATTGFTRLESLQTLVLSHNPIKSLKVHALFGLTSLQRLYLENCQLSEIDDTAFITLYNLKYLYLQNNRLTTISSAWFEVFSSNQIVKVLLSGNPWRCDCKMAGFMNKMKSERWLEDVTEVDVVYCHSPEDRRQDTLAIAGDVIVNLCPVSDLRNSRKQDLMNNPDIMIEDLDYKFDDLIEDASENEDTDNAFEQPRFNDLPELGQPVENSVFQPKSPGFQQNSQIQENSPFQQNNEFQQNSPFQEHIQQNSPFQVEDSVLAEEQAQNFQDEQPFIQKSPEQLNQVVVEENLEENEYENDAADEDAQNEPDNYENTEEKSEENSDENPDENPDENSNENLEKYSDDDTNELLSAVPEVDQIVNDDTNEYENIDEKPDENPETNEYSKNPEQQAADFIEQHIANEGSNYGDDIELNLPESDGQADSSLQYEQIANQNETGLAIFDPEQHTGTITTGFKVTLSLIVMLIIFYMGNVNNSFRQFKYKIMGLMKSRANSGQLPANGYMPLGVDDKEDVFRL